MSRCPWTSRTARPPRSSQATSAWTTSCSPARTPTRSHEATEGLGPDAPRRRKPLRRGRPGWRPRGRRADEQRTGPALHHGPSAQHGRRSAGSNGPCGRRSARGGAGLPLPAPPGRCRVRPHERIAPPRAAAATTADQQGSEDAAVQDVRSANNMNDATQPQHFTLRSGSTSGSPASSRASSLQAQTNHTPRPFSWGLNPVTLPHSQPNSRASSRSSGCQSRLPPPSYDQLARDIEAA